MAFVVSRCFAFIWEPFTFHGTHLQETKNVQRKATLFQTLTRVFGRFFIEFPFHTPEVFLSFRLGQENFNLSFFSLSLTLALVLSFFSPSHIKSSQFLSLSWSFPSFSSSLRLPSFSPSSFSFFKFLFGDEVDFLVLSERSNSRSVEEKKWMKGRALVARYVDFLSFFAALVLLLV